MPERTIEESNTDRMMQKEQAPVEQPEKPGAKQPGLTSPHPGGIEPSTPEEEEIADGSSDNDRVNQSNPDDQIDRDITRLKDKP